MEKNVQIPTDIREYLESILKEGEMLTLDEETREGMIQELFYQLDNYLASVIVKNLEEKDLERFIQLNEERKSKGEIEAYVKEKIPEAQKLFSNAFIEFKQLYLSNVETARSKQTEEKKEEE